MANILRVSYILQLISRAFRRMELEENIRVNKLSVLHEDAMRHLTYRCH